MLNRYMTRYAAAIVVAGLFFTAAPALAQRSAPLNPSYITARVISVTPKEELVYGVESPNGRINAAGRYPIAYDQIAFVVENCDTYEHSDTERRRPLECEYEVGVEYVLNSHSDVLKPGHWFIARTPRFDGNDPRNLLEVNRIDAAFASLKTQPKNDENKVSYLKGAFPKSIGTATMTRDGMLILDLKGTQANPERHTEVYQPTHSRYEEVYQHIGGIQRGQYKPIPPWD
ncbi:MAG: hypothetical protein HKM24_08125 [Gammaproteobacteria bacterium]|nr:hypothetical protein [Gammaproteobacteria bacterium]